MTPLALPLWKDHPFGVLPEGVEVRRGLVADRWAVVFIHPEKYSAGMSRGFVSTMEATFDKSSLPKLLEYIDAPRT